VNEIRLPNEVKLIINTLTTHGFSAYAVGGCVRDALRGTEPHDWDICTSAPPEKIKEVFAKYRTVDTGIRHGTITVVMSCGSYEVTTFRIDGVYSDGRHPDTVTFTDSIVEDLSRRDFTINAMAYNPDKGLFDPFGGRHDLAHGIIRCVGCSTDRFNEDPLRILRAMRFASVFNFDIHPDTKDAIRFCRGRLCEVSKERIAAELSRMLVGCNIASVMLDFPDVFSEIIPELGGCVGFDQKNPHHKYDVYTHIAYAVFSYGEDDLSVKLALFLHDIAKPIMYTETDDGIRRFLGHELIGAKMAENILRRLRYDNKTIDEVVSLILHHDSNIADTNKCVRRWMNRIGERRFGQLLDVMESDACAKSDDVYIKKREHLSKVRCIYEDILLSGMCFSLKDLKIDGNDILYIGLPQGKAIGEILRFLLDRVISGEIENDRDVLLKEAGFLVGQYLDSKE